MSDRYPFVQQVPPRLPEFEFRSLGNTCTASKILGEIIEYLIPDGYFYEHITKIVEAQGEALQAGVPEEEVRLAIQGACIELAGRMLTVRKKNANYEACYQIRDIVRKNIQEEERNRSLDTLDFFNLHTLGAFDGEFIEQFVDDRRTLTEQEMLSLALSIMFERIFFEPDVTDIPEEKRDWRKELSTWARRVLNWVVILVIASIIVMIFIFLVLRETGL